MRLLIFFLLLTTSVFSHHNKGAYFYYEQISDKLIQVTLITYIDRKADDYQNDKVNYRDSVQFFWGDNSITYLKRINGIGTPLNENVIKNIYQGTHKYKVHGNYKIGFYDPYRVHDVTNMSDGVSGSTLMFVDGVVPVQNSRDSCINKSSIPQHDFKFFMKSTETLEMNAAHFDPDGDSLYFQLINCKGSTKSGGDAKDYEIPSTASMDKYGNFTFSSPKPGGVYCFAYMVEEFRKGEKVGWTTFDFTVLVDKKVFGKGTVSNITGLNLGKLDFTSSGTKKVSFQYDNNAADTVIAVFGSGLKKVNSFSVQNKAETVKNQLKDTIEINYLGSDNQDGVYGSSVLIKSVFGIDTVYDYFNLLVRTTDKFVWDCAVPKVDVLQSKPNGTAENLIAPSIFEGKVWVNFGENFEAAKLQIYDLRGRIVYDYNAFNEQLVQLDLTHLRRAAYIAVISNDSGLRIVQKIIRK